MNFLFMCCRRGLWARKAGVECNIFQKMLHWAKTPCNIFLRLGSRTKNVTGGVIMDVAETAQASSTSSPSLTMLLLILLAVAIIVLIIVLTRRRANNPLPANKSKGSVGYGILSFFIPIVGLVLFLVWRQTEPGNSRVSGIGALIGVIVWTVVPLVAYFAVLQTVLH